MSPNVDLPVIDISRPSQEVGDALVDAAARYGFVFVKGSNISPQQADRTFQLSHELFASERSEKEKYAIGPDNRGWSCMHSETLDPKQRIGDFKEAFNIAEFNDGKPQQPLPDSLAQHEAELSEFSSLCRRLCNNMLRLFALGLKIDPKDGGENWFSSRHDPSIGPSGCILRLLYYPALTSNIECNPEVDIRAGAHSDYGSITLLFQRTSQPGLEILNLDSTWSPVPVYPPGTEHDGMPPILVNIGDILQYWTNGLLRSTVHRVIFPRDAKSRGADRYSIAYFCHPVDRTPLLPVPSEMVKAKSKLGEQGREANGKGVMTAAEYLRSRLSATYHFQ